MSPPVALLHGLATSARRTWFDTGWVDLLTDEGRTVVAPDLPGHATADPPLEPEGYAHFEQDVLALLPEGELDAVGFSLGGRTLLSLAADHPGRFRRLVVAGVGANLFRHDDPAPLADALAGGTAADSPAPLARHFADLARSSGTDPRAVSAILRCPRPPCTAERLGLITAPTLVVLGDADPAGPAEPLLDALADARLVTLRGVDHFATPKSMRFLDEALRFLA